MINFAVAPNSPFAVGENPQAIDQGDFNNDGNLDIITLNHEDSNLSILLGDGTGSFGAAINFGTLPEFVSISDLAIDDLNNDGNLDIVANYFNSPEDNSYAVFLGDGTGQFDNQEDFGLPRNPSSTNNAATRTVSALDFNQDGNQDLIFGRSSGIVIALGDGQGGFSENLFLDVGTLSRKIVPRDLDQDGNLDLVVALGSARSEIALIYGGADNSVSIQSYQILDSESEESVIGSIQDFVIEDFDNDGSLDFLAEGSSQLFLGLGDGEGGFLAPEVNQIGVSEDVPQSVVDLESADFNLDGNADLILTAVNGTILLYGDGQGNFTEEFRFEDASPFGETNSENSNLVNEGQITVGDFNSDGTPDFATVDSSIPSSSSNDVSVVLSESVDTEISDVSVYRFLNTDTQTQFYTTSEVEKDVLENDLPQYELNGVSFIGLSVTDAEIDSLTGISPVHRFFNTTTGVHLYTVDETEKTFIEDNLMNYEYEGVPYYSYDTQEADSIPLYRFFNEKLGAHFYTPSLEERDLFIESPDYQIEGGGDGIAFYINPAE